MIAIYARQSIEKKDSISIESQIEHAKREIFGEEFKVYQDSGFSGKNTNRPAFAQMMQDVESGLIEKVVVYRLDRVSRSTLDFANFINTLEAHNASFVSVTEKFDTSTPMGRTMLYIVAAFAQLERETIAERVKDNYYARVRKGAWGGGPAAFGFDLIRTTIDGKKATICQPNEHIETVRRIFELYAQPHSSLADVQRQLKSENITTEKGVPFTTNKLSIILKNPAYVRADAAIYNYYKSKGVIIGSDLESFDSIHGCILVGKREANERKYTNVENHLLAVTQHEGIIESDVFLRCQNKLSQNKQIKNTFKGKYTWLTGMVKCEHCGYACCIRVSPTKDGPTPYMVCSGRYLYHSCAESKGQRASLIEGQVASQMIERLADLRMQKKKKEAPVNKELQKKILDIDAKIENLVMSLEESSGISVSYISQRIEALHAQKEQLLQESAEILSTSFDFSAVPQITSEDWATMELEEKRTVARHLIDTVFVGNNGVSVKFKFE